MAVMAVTAIGLAFGSCQRGIDGGEESTGLAIKVYSPTKVIQGQVVTINGTSLDEVTSVVFPGGIGVTDITVLGNGQISVVTPAGVAAEGGELTVKAGDMSATARVPMTVGKPEFRTISYPDSEGGPGAWLTVDLLITGIDLEFIEQAVFPGKEGDITINALDFVRKANNMLKIKVPVGIKEGTAKIQLFACNGAKLETSEVLLVDAIPGIKEPLEGEWVWASSGSWGNGGYMASTGPAWWIVNVGPDLDAQGAVSGEGLPESSMTFTRTELTLNRADGTSKKGLYKLDMTVTKPGWSIGQLTTSDVTVLVGRWPVADAQHDIYAYDVLELTDSRLVLAYAPEGTAAWDTGYFWVFERKGAAAAAYPVDLDLSQGQMVKLEGIDNIADYWIDPDFFTRLDGSDNQFTFQAAAGTYRIDADKNLKYFKIEALSNGEPATTQADGSGVVWIIGDGGIGKPSAAAKGISWTPDNALCMAPIGGKKYRITLVAGEQIGTDAINFKFFHQKGWGGEFTNEHVTTTSDLIVLGDGNNGADPGNLMLAPGVTLESGKAYEFILDVSGGSGAAVLSVTAK